MYSQDDDTTFGWEAEDNKNPTLEDFKKNGKYCSSGLAYPVDDDEARCTSFKQMKFNGKVTPYPYACNPED